MPNRLASEFSPYLLQHAENPVNWYPWGEEAFLTARGEDKPIFLSIGYSTCHWCHVMEEESFKNHDVADLLNKHFVSIKVDREERPDVDRIYMSFVQAMTGSGGWPMSVWLTGDLKPFFGGTYFPPTSRFGRPGFTEILKEVVRSWNEKRLKLIESADTMLDRLRQLSDANFRNDNDQIGLVANVEVLSDGVEQFIQAFDPVHGGFGVAPKFPRPAELFFLLREYARVGDERSLDMVVRTLDAMSYGGMRDHLGGGFHRYSVDTEWRMPHFEKMLYDQAQLALAYLEVGQATGKHRFLEIAVEVLSYVSRELVGSEGEFLSAEDADSLPLEHKQTSLSVASKREGEFYVWTDQEIDLLLGVDSKIFKFRYGIEPASNVLYDQTANFPAKHQLYEARTITEASQMVGCSEKEAVDVFSRASQKLLTVRSRRPRPHLDDKTLTAWNGLMIASYARAAHVFEGESFGNVALQCAQQAAKFAKKRLWDPNHQTLWRRFRKGQIAIHGYAEDYACLIWGLLELFQADGEASWLEWAWKLQARQDDLFWDTGDGGWFSTTGFDASVLLRMKEDYDGAELSAGSVSVLNLQTLFHLTGDQKIKTHLVQALARFGSNLGKNARRVPMMAAALSSHYSRASQIVVVGKRNDQATRDLWRCVARHYLPFAVRVNVDPSDQQQILLKYLPFVKSMQMIREKPTAYVCSNFTCKEPVTDVSALDIQLRECGAIR